MESELIADSVDNLIIIVFVVFDEEFFENILGDTLQFHFGIYTVGNYLAELIGFV